MLPRNFRIGNSWIIRRIINQGQPIYSRSFVLIISPISNLFPEGPKFAFVASKKIGKAIHRNRAVRILRSAVFQTITHFSSRHYYVLIARKGIIGQKTSAIQDEILHRVLK